MSPTRFYSERLTEFVLVKALWTYIVYTTSPPGGGVIAFGSVVHVDAVKAVGRRIMHHSAPGMVAFVHAPIGAVENGSKDLRWVEVAMQFEVDRR